MQLAKVDDSLIRETAEFAQNVFIDYYTDLIGIKQSVYMAEKFLSQDVIRKLIDEGAVFTLVKEGDQILGFYECQKEENRMFLSKLYVDKHYRGKGIGRFMFDDLLNYTRDNNLSRIYLTVNKGNTPSFNIYRHLGFEVIDAVETDIGQGYIMDDYIMQLEIDNDRQKSS